MAFNFPVIERKIYKWTFLKDVSVGFEFKAFPWSVSEDALKEMFYKYFQMENVSEQMVREGIRLQDNSKRVELFFKLSDAKIKLRFPLYTSFDVMKKFLPIMDRFFKALSLERLTEVYVEKYNELDYTFKKKDVNVVRVMKEIFSPNLLDNEFYKNAESFDQLSRWERNLEFEDEEEKGRQVSIDYGFYKKDNAKGLGTLTLKTKAVLSTSISASNFMLTLENLNDLIDRVFRWCVTDGIIEKMDRGNG